MSVFTNEITIDPAALPIPVSGTVTATPSGIQDVNLVSTISVPVTGPLTDGQLRATPVPISGTVTTSNVTSNSATITQVVLSSNTNATLLAANANRKKAILFAPKSTLYIKFGTTASSTSFTYIVVAANTLIEINTWIGQIDILSTVNQTVTVTELV